jgi:hypothetical protein
MWLRHRTTSVGSLAALALIGSRPFASAMASGSAPA